VGLYTNPVNLSPVSQQAGDINISGGISAATIGSSPTQQHVLPAVASDTIAVLAAAQTLTNKTISGASNILTDIDNGSLTNSSVTVSAGAGLSGGGAVALGATTTLSVGGTADAVYSTGSFTWTGASGKALALTSTAAAISITAGQASTWDTADGTVKAAAFDRATAGLATFAGTTATSARLGGTNLTSGLTIGAGSGALMNFQFAGATQLTLTATLLQWSQGANKTFNIATAAADTQGYQLSLSGGAAGTASTANGAPGGQLFGSGGKGANASGSFTAGGGGQNQWIGGTGGDGTATLISGSGGSLLLAGGPAGTNNGGGQAVGGTVTIRGGVGGTNGAISIGATNTGSVSIGAGGITTTLSSNSITYGDSSGTTRTILGIQRATANAAGGALVLAASGGGNSDGSTGPGGKGGSATFRSAVGGNGSGAFAPGDGGDSFFMASAGGTGGTGNSNGGNSYLRAGSGQGTGIAGSVIIADSATTAVTLGANTTFSDTKTATFSANNNAATQTAVIYLQNNTNANVTTVVQQSPGIEFSGTSYDATNGVVAKKWLAQAIPVSSAGNSIANQFGFYSSEGGTAYGLRAYFNSSGAVVASGNVYTGGAAGNGTVYAATIIPNTAATAIGIGTSNTSAISVGATGVPISVFGPIGINTTITQNIASVTAQQAALLVLATTPATSSGTQSNSPGIQLRSQHWETTAAAAQTIDWMLQAVPNAAASPVVGQVSLYQSKNGGAWTERARISDSGSIIAINALSAGSNGDLSVFGATFAPNVSSQANFGTNTNTTQINIGRSGINVMIPGGIIRATTPGNGVAGVSMLFGQANGGPGSGATPGGLGGSTTLFGGQGGAATTTAGGTAANGGATAVTGGQGGTGAASTNGPAIGGTVTITGGKGGDVTSGFGASNGGPVQIRGGLGQGTGKVDGTVAIGDATTSAIAMGASGCTISFGQGTVTQATSITTGVTVNASSGVITTVSSTLAAQGTSTFTITNNTVTATSVVKLTVGTYGGTFGTNGTPVAIVSAVASGSFNITIYNAHASNALNGTLKIHFAVL
jgi:hypothetical protein